MTDTTKQIASFDPGRVLQDQVAAWTKERDRLQELIDTASPAATPSPVPADTAELPPDLAYLLEYIPHPRVRAEAKRKIIDAIASCPAPGAAMPQVTDVMVDAAFNRPDKAPEIAKKFMRETLERAFTAALASQPDQSAQEVKCFAADCDKCNAAPVAPSAAQAAGVDYSTMPPLPKAAAMVKSSQWSDALTKRQSFNGWRINYGDCDVDLFTADQMIELRSAAFAAGAQAALATTPSEGVAAPVLEADLLALREDVAKLYQSAMAITSQAAQEFAQRVVEHVRRTHGVAPAQPSAEQVRDAALEEAARECALVDLSAYKGSKDSESIGAHYVRIIRALKSTATQPAPVAVAPVESAGASSVAGEGLTEMLQEICNMQQENAENGIATRIALAELCEKARAILATQAERQPQPAAQAADRPNLSAHNHVGQGLRLAEAIAKEQSAAPAAVPQGVEAQKGGADHD